jgi:branched-chain amino acid transport system permease protein
MARELLQRLWSRVDWASAAPGEGSGGVRLSGRFLPWRAVGTVVAVLAACLWPLEWNSSYVLDIGFVVALYVLLVLGMHLLFGIAGLPFLGYAGLYGIGAYVAAILNVKYGLSIDWTFLISPLVVCLFSGLLGLLFLRLRDVYFMVATLAVGELVPIIADNLNVTGGPNGLYGITAPGFGSARLTSLQSYYYFTLVLIVVSCVALVMFSGSSTGISWLAVGRGDRAAEALGVRTRRVKLICMTLSGLWAGLAGVIYVTQLSAVDPSAFTVNDSILLAGAVLIGGMGSLGGAVVATVILYSLPQVVSALTSYRLLIFGVAIMVILKARPQGLLPRKPKNLRLPLGPAGHEGAAETGVVPRRDLARTDRPERARHSAGVEPVPGDRVPGAGTTSGIGRPEGGVS